MTDITIDRIQTYLSKIYPVEQSEATAQQLSRILQAFREAAGRAAAPPSDTLFSEEDVILITYGDTLRQADQTPLETLHSFAKAHLDGVISTIHILPFYPYSSDDGFSVQDFYAVNPALGGWAEIEHMEQDFKLMFDAVFNHMSAQSAWFQAFLADDPAYEGLFRTEDPETDLSQVTRPRATPLLTAFTKPNGEITHVWTTFSADQVDFNANHPATVLRLIEILLFYVEKGASIIRLDAIAYLWKEAGTNSIHLPQTHDVIRLMRAVLDEVAPHVMLITETNVPHAENIAYFGDGADEAQMVYNFTLPPLLFHTLLSGDASKLRAWVKTLHTPSDRTTFFNFTASHDGIGVRPVEGILDAAELAAMIAHVEASWGRVSYKQNSDGSRSPYELNITYLDAIINPSESTEWQVRRFMISQGIALALAGVPAVYIHSLLGSRNDWDGVARTGHNRTINRAKLDYAMIENALADEQTMRSQIFRAYTHLLTLRKGLKAFHPNAPQQVIDLDVPGVFALLRTAQNDEERILAVYNVTNQAQSVDMSAYISDTVTDTITGRAFAAQFSLAAYEMLWLKL